MSERTLRYYRVAEGVLLAAVLAAGYRSWVLDGGGDSDRAFWAIVIALVLMLMLVGVVVADVLSASPPESAQPSASHHGTDVGEGAATVSAVAGTLAWLPFLPITSPLVWASVAAVAGLVALRALGPWASRRRDHIVAASGLTAGLTHFILRLALGVPF